MEEISDKIDVIMCTMDRPTLPTVIKRIKKVMPNANIIYVRGKGQIGDLRNIGLYQTRNELAALIDDDTLITPEWVLKAKEVLRDPNAVIAAFCVKNVVIVGNARYESPAMMLKPKKLKELGGFPRFDSDVLHKKGTVWTEGDFGVIHYARKEDLFLHSLRWIFEGFSEEYPFGHNNGISSSINRVIYNMTHNDPFQIVIDVFWFVKAVYVKLFTVVGLP